MLDEAVAVAVAVAGRSTQARTLTASRAPCRRHGRSRPRRTKEELRGVDGAVAVEPELRCPSVHLVTIFPARRRSPGQPSSPAARQHVDGARRELGPSSSVWSDVIAVSRPKTVMNHSSPAANSGRRSSPLQNPERREVGDGLVESTAQGFPAAAASGTRSVQAWTTSPIVSSSSIRAPGPSAVQSAERDGGEHQSRSSQLSCGSSASGCTTSPLAMAPGLDRRGYRRSRRPVPLSEKSSVPFAPLAPSCVGCACGGKRR